VKYSSRHIAINSYYNHFLLLLFNKFLHYKNVLKLLKRNNIKGGDNRNISEWRGPRATRCMGKGM